VADLAVAVHSGRASSRFSAAWCQPDFGAFIVRRHVRQLALVHPQGRPDRLIINPEHPSRVSLPFDPKYVFQCVFGQPGVERCGLLDPDRCVGSILVLRHFFLKKGEAAEDLRNVLQAVSVHSIRVDADEVEVAASKLGNEGEKLVDNWLGCLRSGQTYP